MTINNYSPEDLSNTEESNEAFLNIIAIWIILADAVRLSQMSK